MKAWTRRDLTIVPIGTQDWACFNSMRKITFSQWIFRFQKQIKAKIHKRKKCDFPLHLKHAQDCIVIACDSCGAVGLKDSDILKLPPRYAGKFTARVALTEVLCSGAFPVTLANGVANEMNPTGNEIIMGIQEELENAGIPELILTGSTEENFATAMTGLAITVIGTTKIETLKFAEAIKGDKIILIGNPNAGAAVNLESKGFYHEIKRFLPMKEIKELVPVGSKGIAYEANTLAALSGKAFKPYDTGIDYNASAGPATCLLVLCSTPMEEGVMIGEII